ncbi:hypothetical protein AB0C44_00445 [Micromonospora taraxaci]|uniref:hypothetical protein n=1 Tax=Micromonospora taraxaci TaxID=1316803 RepID=UPI0034017550
MLIELLLVVGEADLPALISHRHRLSRSSGLDAGERSRSVVAYLTRPVFVAASSATMRP